MLVVVVGLFVIVILYILYRRFSKSKLSNDQKYQKFHKWFVDKINSGKTFTYNDFVSAFSTMAEPIEYIHLKQLYMRKLADGQRVRDVTKGEFISVITGKEVSDKVSI